MRARWHAGEAVAVAGPSGVGKSGSLMQIDGLGDDRGITIAGLRPTHWPETALRAVLTALPPRTCCAPSCPAR